jgi:translation elongation factor EF-4
VDPARRHLSRFMIRQFGKVEIPQSAFIAALKMGDG